MQTNTTMKTLVFASGNPHKASEINDMLGNAFRIIPLSQLQENTDLPETSDTLEGNALQKARAVYEAHGTDCFAEDTGLEIEALGGAPGVYTARYAGEAKDPQANMNKVLQELTNASTRNARFRTVIALILDGQEHLFTGVCEGKIATEQSGEKGFGYDPVFIPDGYNTTFADMAADEKNAISHRGKALRALIDFLK